MNDNIGSAKIKAYAERIIRLTEEAEALAEDIREIRNEAKGEGYNLKALNTAIKVARMSADKREAYDSGQMDLELYLAAIDGKTEE